MSKVREELRAIGGKVKAQALKDYIAWPLLSGLAAAALEGGPGAARRAEQATARAASAGGLAGVAASSAAAAASDGCRATTKANATANAVRNAWAYAIIFCGHFPDQTYTFSEEEIESETQGGWYVRQLLGSANIEGSPLFHVASGNLGYQVEHHLFPDMPSSRYAEVAPQVKDVCERYGAALQRRSVRAPTGHGPAHDPAPRPAGRKAAAQARALRGRGRLTRRQGYRMGADAHPARRRRLDRPRRGLWSAVAGKQDDSTPVACLEGERRPT